MTKYYTRYRVENGIEDRKNPLKKALETSENDVWYTNRQDVTTLPRGGDGHPRADEFVFIEIETARKPINKNFANISEDEVLTISIITDAGEKKPGAYKEVERLYTKKQEYKDTNTAKGGSGPAGPSKEWLKRAKETAKKIQTQTAASTSSNTAAAPPKKDHKK